MSANARVIALAVEPVALSQDPAQGRYLYTTRGCADCHGANGAGNTVVDDGGLLVVAPSSGQRPDGSAISRVVPFASLGQMTDTDLRALHAYLRASAPRETGQR